jgi:hypothetical protein
MTTPGRDPMDRLEILMTDKAFRIFARRLGGLSLVALVVAHLALTDIRHGEADVTLEWNVLRGAFVIIAVFHVVSMRALLRGFDDGTQRAD